MKTLDLITSLFNKTDIYYWLDQGTLLRIYRDGYLPEKDDIDISTLYFETKKIEQVIPQILKFGYRLRSCYYKGILFQLKFLPICNNKLKTIDLKIYYDSNKDFYWSVKKKVKNYQNWVMKKTYSQIIKNWYWPSDKAIIDKLPLSVAMTPLTWILPKEYIDVRDYQSNYNFYMPSKTEEYLTYHFGDWHIVNNDWKSYKNDKGVIHSSPEKVLNTSCLLKYIEQIIT